MGSDAFRSLFTLYQSKTRVSTHVEMVSHSLMTDPEPAQGIEADDHHNHVLQVCKINTTFSWENAFSLSGNIPLTSTLVYFTDDCHIP